MTPRDRREPGVGLAATLKALGHCELQATTSYERLIGSEGLSFRARDDVVKFHWETVADDGSTMAAGLDVLALPADGRIQRSYTFVDGA